MSWAACIAALKRSPAIMAFMVLGVAGCILFYVLAPQVFASASIDLKYSNSEILKIAKDKLKEWGYDQPGTKSTADFGSDPAAKNFLEQTYGQAEANKLMSKVPVWFWKCTFEKEKEPKTIFYIDPDGKLLHFDRTLPNDLRLPSLDRKSSESLAMHFVEKEAGIDLSTWKLIQSSDSKLQDRVDHSFVWSDPSVDYRGAQPHVSVNISGDKVSSFIHYLNCPESWINQFNLSRSYNNTFATVATSLYYLFTLGAVAVFIQGIVKKTFSYKTAFIFGGIYSIAEFARFATYLSKMDYSSAAYALGGFGGAIGMSIASGLGIAVLFAAAQPLYRQICPKFWPLKDWFTGKMLRSPELIQGIIIGYFVCFLTQGYQILYYLIGERVGYWCPLSGGSYATLSSAFPFLDAFHIGISASFYEEILFRVIGLALLQKLFRGNFWIANLLQAAIWGFAHSNYPQQPAYARGIELTVEGLFDGWLLRQYGLVPNLVSHYLFDVMWTIDVLRTAPPAVAATGLIPVLIPALILAVSIAVSARKGFVYPPVVTLEQMRKTAEFLKMKATIGRPIGFIYNALSKRAITIISVLSAMSLGLCLFWQFNFLKPIGTDIKPLQIKRGYAIDAATAYFRDLNISLDGCVTGTWLSALGYDDATTMRTVKYLVSQGDYGKAKTLIEKLYPLIWIVQFQKIDSPINYGASFDQSGNLISVLISPPEDSRGANLTEDEARVVAEKFFEKHRSQWLPIALLDAETNKRKNRTDHTFRFSVPSGKCEKAELAAVIGVKGDMVAHSKLAYRIPDSWTKSHSDTPANTFDTALCAIHTSWLLIGLSIWLFYSLWREGHARWKLAIIFGLAMAILELLRWANTLPWLFLAYDGTSALPNYVTTKAIGWVTSAINEGLSWTACAVLAFAVMHKFYKRSYLESALSLVGVREPAERATQRRFWLDAFLIATYVVLADRAFDSTIDCLKSFLLQPAIFDMSYYISSVSATSAAFRIVANAFTTDLTCLYLAIVLPAISQKFLRGKWWLVSIVVVLCAGCYCIQFGPDALNAFLIMLWTFAFVFALFFIARRNFLAVLLILLWIGLIPPLEAIYRLALSTMIFDWCLLLGLCLMPFLWFIYLQIAPSPEMIELAQLGSGPKSDLPLPTNEG